MTPTFCKKTGLKWSPRVSALCTIGSPTQSIGTVAATVRIGDHVDTIVFEVIPNDITSILIGNRDGLKYGFKASGPVFCTELGSNEARVLLTDNIDERLAALKADFDSLFAVSDYDVGLISGVEMQINLKEEKVVYSRPRRYPDLDQHLIDKHIEECLRAGFIRPSQSAFASQVTLAKCENKATRVCVDYRKLNELTVPDRYPIPKIDELIQDVQGSTVFTKLDLIKGYHQLKVKEEDVHKTAFVVRNGLYEWVRVPFGLKNAPAVFQRAIELVLRPCRDFAMVYFDDIVVHSRDCHEHLVHLRAVLGCLHQAGIKLRRNKCSFMTSTISYCGSIIQDGKLTRDDQYISSVRDIGRPSNIHEVNRFLGLVGYSRQFIPKFASIAQPLHDLKKRESEFIWSSDCEQAFQTLVREVTSNHCLFVFDPTLETMMHTDASGYAVGGALVQIKNKRELVIGYFSKVLNEHEKKYSIFNRELLAVVVGLKKFHQFVCGRTVTIVTDHNSLKHLVNAKDPYGRIARWLILLQYYDLRWEYRKGDLNVIADAMSRPHLNGTVAVLRGGNLRQEVLRAQREMPWEAKVDLASRYKLELTPETLLIKRVASGAAYFVPVGKRISVVTQYHYSPGGDHSGVRRTAARLAMHYYWPYMLKTIEDVIRGCKICNMNKPLRVGQVVSTLDCCKEPLEQVHVDTVKLPRCYHYLYVMTFVDRGTRYVQAYAITSLDWRSVRDAYVRFIREVGKPQVLITDRHGSFNSEAAIEFYENRAICHRETPSYRPQANGMVERFNRTLKEKIKMMSQELGSAAWSKTLHQLIAVYNETPHSVTGYPPAYLLFGVWPGSDSPVASEVLEEDRTCAYERSVERQQQNLEQKIQDVQPFELNQWVYLKNERKTYQGLKPRYEGPYRITRVRSPYVYDLKLNTRSGPEESKVHYTRLKAYVEPVKER